MTERDKNQKVEERTLLSAAKSTLDQHTEQLDAATLARLSAARREAINVARTRQPHKARPGWIVPVGSFASIAAVLGVALALWTQEPTIKATPMAMLEDIHLLTDAEEIEFYEELEFYEWLASEAQTVS